MSSIIVMLNPALKDITAAGVTVPRMKWLTGVIPNVRGRLVVSTP